MLDLYVLKNAGEPFPRTYAGYFHNPEELMERLEFTKQDMTDLLNGKILREKYYVEFTSDWLDNLAHEMVCESESKTYSEIADILEIKECDVRKYISRTKKKLQKSGRLKHFEELMYEYFSTKRRIIPREAL